MNTATIIVLLFVASAAVGAILYMVKHKAVCGCGSCNGCDNYRECTNKNKDN